MSSKGSLKARKSAARLLAVQAVYQAIQNKHAPSELYDEYVKHRAGMEIDGDRMVDADPVLFRNILSGATERWGDLQQMITSRLKASKDIEPLLTAILVCGAFELLAHHDIDAPIIISDYLNITSSFFESSEPKLVNAILDALGKELRSS